LIRFATRREETTKELDFSTLSTGAALCICGNICGTLPLRFSEDNMPLLFHTQVQIAIKNHLETIKRLLDAPHTEKLMIRLKDISTLSRVCYYWNPPVHEILCKLRLTSFAEIN
jgi:hypothetical protein